MGNSEPTPGPGWRTVEHAGGSVLVDCPSDWTVEKSGHSLVLESPTGAEAVTLSTFVQPEATVEEFSRARFAVEQEIYKPIGAPRELTTHGQLTGRTLHSQGVYPGEDDQTVRYLFCVCTSPVCAAISVYTSPANFEAQKPVYDRIFRSIVFKDH